MNGKSKEQATPPPRIGILLDQPLIADLVPPVGFYNKMKIIRWALGNKVRSFKLPNPGFALDVAKDVNRKLRSITSEARKGNQGAKRVR